jgi:hypothetical protein
LGRTAGIDTTDYRKVPLMESTFDPTLGAYWDFAGGAGVVVEEPEAGWEEELVAGFFL